MNIKVSISILTIVIIGSLSNCAKQPTLVDQFYGTSYELAKQSQIHNPQAGIADGTSTGLEGSVASKVVERYEKGFQQKAATTNTYSVIFEGMNKK